MHNVSLSISLLAFGPGKALVFLKSDLTVNLLLLVRLRCANDPDMSGRAAPELLERSSN
jgi:hypothetical protein